jgi:crotonobetainyl-CoA:carnitine CoA-transferase CaiB-like acyl-CoA transferase
VSGVTTGRPGGLSSLSDLRVIELGVWVAAPAVGALLADWGAEVIKIEPATGDPMRWVFGSIGASKDLPNPAFTFDNRGKRSAVLDLAEPFGREQLERLLERADVFVSNLRPDALEKLGLDPGATVERHPRLVYCSISGYGLRGEERNRPSYDLGAFWARSGLSHQMADSDGVPLNARGAIGDHITGLAALSGVLAAVLEQRHTGRGQVVEVSLLGTGAYVLGWDLSLQLALGKVAGPEARHENRMALMNSYRTSDGRWFFFIGLEMNRHLPAVCRALGRPDLTDDPRFADAASIRRNAAAVIALFDDIIGRRTLAEWSEVFEREGVWWAPVRNPAEVLADPQFVANDGIIEIASETDDPVQRSIGGPVIFSDVSRRPGPAPGLGEHTAEILEELSRRDPP